MNAAVLIMLILGGIFWIGCAWHPSLSAVESGILVACGVASLGTGWWFAIEWGREIGKRGER